MSIDVDIVTMNRSCLDKKRYGTEDVAKAVAIKCWYERKTDLRAYACEVCGGWHLTSINAAPMMKAGWRLPKTSQRQMADQRERKKRRR